MATVNIRVDLNVEQEVLPKVDDDLLLKECRERGIDIYNHQRLFELIEDMRHTFAEQDGRHFEILLFRLLSIAGVPRQKLKETKPTESQPCG